MAYIKKENDETAVQEKKELLIFYDSLSLDKKEKFMKFIRVLNESMQNKKASK